MSAFYDLASLVVVPSGYKASKVYAQKPLTTDGQLAFTRSTTATRVNSAGLIESVAINVPRLDYLNSTCPKLLLEPQRSNIITYSSEFDNGAWTKTSIAVTANAAVSPDGTSNADLFTTNDPAGTVYRAYHNSTGGTDATNTISAFFKYGNHPYAYITADYGGLGKYAVFNVQTGVITFTSTGYTSTITDYGNGWYRCALTGTIDSNNNVQFGLATSATVYAGTSLANGKTLYAWGAQREYNVSYATSYIPTLGAAVTRGADFAVKTGISSLIGQTEGTLFVEAPIEDVTSNHTLIRAGITSSFANSIIVEIVGARVYGIVYVSSVAQCNIFSEVQTAGSNVKVALAYKENDFALYINGVQIGTDNSGSVPSSVGSLWVGNIAGAEQNTVKQALLFTTRLSNANLAALTA